MSRPFPPDPVDLAIAYLAQDADVLALLAAATDISGKLPATVPMRHIQVAHVDGSYRRPRPARTSSSLLDINCRAEDDIAASLLTRVTSAALMDAPRWHNQLGVIVRVVDAGGPHEIPDSNETTPTPRQVFTIRIDAHA